MLKGKVIKYKRDNINTDEIIPAKFLNISEPRKLAEHCMEGLDGEFSKKVRKGNIIVAGKNFGCGSSREHAPVAIKASGISCVIAESFARIFFRNAINIGLPICELKNATPEISENDELEIDLTKGEIKNATKNKVFCISPYQDFMVKLINSGGLVNYIRKR
ncbi:MAG: 3-isopropylmalate dehydratase small subunit [Elusimicrobia bacterium CG1_02_37_114]|nr:MAG: 3-isopropylmalate dehydratase small subunit [Elusimicrobia bacterium CG1_02_37_114]PIV52921.1 MAG: 3-isopropylmalate dehydratase small subunit [Elusimicrobia bacterium CG02_land_8_20_14_3_00_37_13]PIZ13259.1 MAG: 3-isopropylmalate dehydratase small subunit [Elusimicrobia bacterium CG_4_10_14_0_8_um_filter_37_32]